MVIANDLFGRRFSDPSRGCFSALQGNPRRAEQGHPEIPQSYVPEVRLHVLGQGSTHPSVQGVQVPLGGGDMRILFIVPTVVVVLFSGLFAPVALWISAPLFLGLVVWTVAKG